MDSCERCVCDSPVLVCHCIHAREFDARRQALKIIESGRADGLRGFSIPVRSKPPTIMEPGDWTPWHEPYVLHWENTSDGWREATYG